MTVIAYDGRTLAADRRATFGTAIRPPRTKIHRSTRTGALIGMCGSSHMTAPFLDWYEAGAVPADFPVTDYDNRYVQALVVETDGRLWLYESSAVPLEVHATEFAIGSGAQEAVVAMHCGKSAAEAVAVASLFDSSCGDGCDVLHHER